MHLVACKLDRAQREVALRVDGGLQQASEASLHHLLLRAHAHCVVAGNVLTRSESGPFTFTPDETQTVLQAGNEKERTRIDGGLLELLYTEAPREWDSKRLVGDSGGLELSDALLVPKFTDALKDLALWWSRIFEEPRPMLSNIDVVCLALLYLSRIINFERRKTWSETST